MNVAEFIDKWKRSGLTERSAAQQHFLDLCAVPKDAEAEAKLAKRPLTNLYNQRPTWLDHAHRKLDEAVAAAYGWPADLSDDEILERLLALNLERASEG